MRKSTVMDSRRSMHPRTPSKGRKSTVSASRQSMAPRQSLGVRYSMAGQLFESFNKDLYWKVWQTF